MRVIARVTAVSLAAIGLLHAVWTVSPWPLTTWRDLARTVVGVEDETGLPPIWMVLAVAFLLFAAAYVVAVRTEWLPRLGPDWAYRWGVWVIAAVLAIRGVVSLVVSLGGLGAAPAEFSYWDIRLYSPLCLVLALGVVAATRLPRANEG